ncbi:MAG: hypothetical protein A2087_08370 [Spirochaetes bacterium GWD1_61_31]|nr:MAG: hypothetical protein A2Y37_02415 [Spirochaetes bacterium GWB1_60_80]OHD33477.1 MAG: hypothetical protein A2004_01160 [Spirochaetes bacterium GWC1_61_12]OHD34764.1 MAG: hypothetical protein A2087_08370 [Spirochaetes bacterium GWD1_61_31]OHD45472.1 MAG: hypothetical protein A2Y35_02685 [Spirochaetes bacterium GWE1_60_18]OHD58044.1 MAG: hypothetical protein A2Y32_05260 [Spirochaetes bacterium GWF1_60_12]HAP44609.1 DUF1015 domain-containing protein [Spirochaetaceae bacterium]
MSTIQERLAGLGVAVPEVCLPASGADYRKWAVVACDQYSSEHQYWEDVAGEVGDAPSTLNMIFPECYLEDDDKAERVKRIQAAMQRYLADKLIAQQKPGFVLLERTTPFEKHPRKGLIMAVDLEAYQYGKGVTSRIRPTEGTIVERLPPRMEIRRGAPLELPHIMLLIDDPARSVIEPLYAKLASFPQLYDFELMKGAGHVRGAHIADQAALEGVAAALEKLADQTAYQAKYGSPDVLLFAVGDGNHSLATAKATWEEIKLAGKAQADIMQHPARYALVELVNIYDDGLPFHPIHRVLFKADTQAVMADLKAAGNCVFEPMSFAAAVAKTDQTAPGEHRFAYVSDKEAGLIRFTAPKAKLAAGTIQEILDAHLKRHAGTVIDYIHGTDSLETLAKKSGNFGLYLPPIDKGSFFATVIKDGVMPRKTFSMGEAPEKRFYIEARRITR